MSILHSSSVDSSSSIATMTTIPPIDLATNSSNDLYDDHTHFQAIFSNDSRFFDTSLHLFKSYCTLGYIPSNGEKSQKHHVPFLTTPSHGHRHRWRARLLGSNQENDHQNGVLKAFLTPTLLRKNVEYSTSNRSDSGISTNEPVNHRGKSPMVVQYQRSSAVIVTVTDESESEITITRL